MSAAAPVLEPAARPNAPRLLGFLAAFLAARVALDRLIGSCLEHQAQGRPVQ